MSMLNVLTNSSTWLLFTVFYVWLIAVKTKYFMKYKRVGALLKEYDVSKNLANKSLDEKMTHLRLKDNVGKDYTQTIFDIILFVLTFMVMLFNKINNLYIGLLIAIIFSLMFSWLTLVTSSVHKNFRAFKYIDSFLNYFYISMFLIYTKFIETIPSLILIVISIILIVYLMKPMNELVGNLKEEKHGS